jgi:chemotaxis protein methyltransferase CheR
MEIEPGSNAEVRTFLEAVYARYGYDFRSYSPVSIRRRVFAALAKSGLHSLDDLQDRMLGEPLVFATVLDDLTVRVSDMFRDPSFYRSFRARVVPLLRTYPLLNVWHCGCASGEEVYSIAILLMEEGLYDRTQIYATDLNASALEQAKLGVYAVDRVPAFAEKYAQSGGTGQLSHYYTAAYDRVVMRDSLRRKILFFQHDLVSDQVFSEMHVIFCRNVLIYFDPELRQRVLLKLSQSACPGGFLCLGSAERLPRNGEGPFSEFVSEERIYRLQVALPPEKRRPLSDGSS